MSKSTTTAFRSGAHVASLLESLEKGTLRQRSDIARSFIEALGRHHKTTLAPVGRTVRYLVEGKPSSEYLAFHTCNYLGLSLEKRIWRAASEATLAVGCGASTSPFGSGRTQLQQEVERALAGFLGVENAIVFSSGFSANMGALIALAGRNDVVLMDSLVHTSFLEGARCTRGKTAWFKHNDMADLESALRECTVGHIGNTLIRAHRLHFQAISSCSASS